MMTRLTLAALLLATAADLSAAKHALRWKSIHEQTTCEAVAPGSCIGEYGFTINATGHFITGPSPSGIRVEGHLTGAELQRLQRAIAQLKQAKTAETCVPSRLIAGTSDRLTLISSNGREHVVFRHESPSQICFRGAQDAATYLHDVMQGLMAEHYPPRFPQ